MSLKISPNAIPFIEDIYGFKLVSALMKVDDKYRLISDNLGQVGELVFAYELYHQWRKELEEFNPDELVIYGEPKKYLVESNMKKRPDLTLHNINDNSNNRIVCEIKTNKNTDIKDDAKKLTQCCLPILDNTTEEKIHAKGYKWGVFIYTFEKNNLTEYFGSDTCEKIIIIHSPSQYELTITTVGEMKKQYQ